MKFIFHTENQTEHIITHFVGLYNKKKEKAQVSQSHTFLSCSSACLSWSFWHTCFQLVSAASRHFVGTVASVKLTKMALWRLRMRFKPIRLLLLAGRCLWSGRKRKDLGDICHYAACKMRNTNWRQWQWKDCTWSLSFDGYQVGRSNPRGCQGVRRWPGAESRACPAQRTLGSQLCGEWFCHTKMCFCHPLNAQQGTESLPSL